MNGAELSEIKRTKIIPMIDDMIYQYQIQNRTDNFSFVKECWKEIEELLMDYNLPTNTFISLNNRYRKLIEERVRDLNK